MSTKKKAGSLGCGWIGLLAGSLLLGLAAVLFIPWNISGLVSHPQPAASYAEALQGIEALRAQRPPGALQPICEVQFLTHGQKAARSIVLVHGYTECPQQFLALGQRYYDLGYNVLIAPMPHHGLAERMTDEQAHITPGDLVAYADQVVDIAQGLGEHVTMLGMSGGGVVTGWAAQNRSDLDLAVLVAPAFGLRKVPTLLTTPVANLYSLLPNSYTWWDETAQEKYLPVYQYPRYASRALAAYLRLGSAVQQQANRRRPAAAKIVVVTNANDEAVNDALTGHLVQAWQVHAADLAAYEFPASMGLVHDLVDTPGQPTEPVYSKLVELSRGSPE